MDLKARGVLGARGTWIPLDSNASYENEEQEGHFWIYSNDHEPQLVAIEAPIIFRIWWYKKLFPFKVTFQNSFWFRWTDSTSMELLNHDTLSKLTSFEHRIDGEICSNVELNLSNSSYNGFPETPEDSSQREFDPDPLQAVSSLLLAINMSTVAKTYSDGD